MDRFLEGEKDRALQEMLDREVTLQNRVSEENLKLSGLKDLDSVLELAAVKFEIANHLLARFDPAKSEPEGPEGASSAAQIIRARSTDAVNLLEELRTMNISEDQKGLITEAEAYAKVRDGFERFILNGGGVFFEAKIDDAKKIEILSQAVADSVRKYMAPDDRYRPVFKTEDLPRFFRQLVNFFLPILAPEGQQDPPYGIEEGEEVQLSSERMKMPLSQAVYYLETELMPQLQKDLEANPGSRDLQRQISLIQDKLREYKNITFRSRATPINLEKGFYTDWLSQYTADGELLVTVSIPVKYKSGTNLDRLREMVQTELVRTLAGKGICPALDEDYRFRKSLESGRRGSSRLPSFKLDIRRGFQELKTLYPALKGLEDRGEFQQLVDLVGSSGRKRSQKLIESMIQGDSRDLLQLP
jgi:hypothetical protein